jgi:hypothetical protein
VGPRFSGKVREEPQRRERDVGKKNCETETFAICEARLVYVRPSNEALPILYVPLKGVAEAALYCAHRASTFLLRAL